MNPVGRYQIAGEIGRGAMGIVYKALDPALGRTVAIKTIQLTDLTDADTRQRTAERLLREAQLAGTLSHPNIVTVYDVLTQNEYAYIVMEFVPGPSLEEMIRQRNLPNREALLLYLRQIAEALDYAHRKGVIHRDVKPANIILSEAPLEAVRVAKITDFGIAKTVSHEATQAGGMTGTPSYMSPEQIEGHPVDGRTDQFSLGVVIYEILSGTKPFAAETLPALLQMICVEEPTPIETVNPALSPTVGKVLRRALAKKPEDRFASASDLVGALSIAMTEAHQPASAPSYSRPLGEAILDSGLSTPGESITRSRDPYHDTYDFGRQQNNYKKLAVIVLLCFVVAAAIVFMIRLQSGSQIPVPVIETRAGSENQPPTRSNVSRVKQTPAVPGANTDSSAMPLQESGEAKAPSVSPAQPRAATRHQPTQSAEPSTAPPASATTAASTSDIDLVSEPAGARIVVDGRSDAACNAPCTMALLTGRHTLTAELRGYATARRIFVLPESNTLYIPLTQSTGILVLNSIPAGLSVSVDGRAQGVTPASLHLSPGIHRIFVSNGAFQHEETVNIEADSFQTKTIRW